MHKQSEIIKQLSVRELKTQLVLSQLILLVLSLVLSYFLFESFGVWFDNFKLSLIDIIYYGLIPGLIIVFIDLIAIRFLPKRFYDDGGINERIFRNLSIREIFFFTLLVAVAEELLFRGVIHITFGYFIASILFALIHFRYLFKPVLLASILLVSFYIGFLFEITGNLFVTITAHFVVDFILGLVIRFQKRGVVYDGEK